MSKLYEESCCEALLLTSLEGLTAGSNLPGSLKVHLVR
jgi:hypothetical protein